MAVERASWGGPQVKAGLTARESIRDIYLLHNYCLSLVIQVTQPNLLNNSSIP
jgi:hypothetical protein